MPYADPSRQVEYQRQWMQRRRDAWFAGKTCAVCGTDQRLHAHHVDPSQKITHRIWSYSSARQAAELAKCIVLCESCHTEHHAVLARSPCGTARKYRNGCRCDACRAAHAAKARADRQKRKNCAGRI